VTEAYAVYAVIDIWHTVSVARADQRIECIDPVAFHDILAVKPVKTVPAFAFIIDTVTPSTADTRV
jgi:hypothetical protein